MLTALHLPIALWLIVGIAYAGGRWNQVAGRMDFIRFTGELLIYYVLIALGGGVFMAFMGMLFEAIGIKAEPFFELVAPCGAAGAVLVASWLVEAKQSVVENMAPVLTRLFTPLFAALLLTFLGTVLWTGRGIDISRNVLIAFDLLLVVVLGLLLYSVSARDPQSPPGAFDVLQVVLVGQRAAGGRGRAVGHRCAHQRVRLHSEPGGRPRRERDSAGQSGVVRGAVRPFPERARIVRERRTLADELRAGLLGVGHARRDHLPALVRVLLTGNDSMPSVSGGRGDCARRVTRSAGIVGLRARGAAVFELASFSTSSS